jgi:hypothetical protein
VTGMQFAGFSVQRRRNIDNWGGGADIHIFVICPINFFWNRLFLQSVNKNIWISAPAIIDIPAPLSRWVFTLIINCYCYKLCTFSLMLINVVLNCNCFLLFCGQKACCICMQAVNSDYILNWLETVKFVFCLQIQGVSKKTQPRNFPRNRHCFKDKRF